MRLYVEILLHLHNNAGVQGFLIIVLECFNESESSALALR